MLFTPVNWLFSPKPEKIVAHNHYFVDNSVDTHQFVSINGNRRTAEVFVLLPDIKKDFIGYVFNLTKHKFVGLCNLDLKEERVGQVMIGLREGESENSHEWDCCMGNKNFVATGRSVKYRILRVHKASLGKVSEILKDMPEVDERRQKRIINKCAHQLHPKAAIVSSLDLLGNKVPLLWEDKTGRKQVWTWVYYFELAKIQRSYTPLGRLWGLIRTSTFKRYAQNELSSGDLQRYKNGLNHFLLVPEALNL